MTEVPAGRVTFMFTDVQGSTGLWEQQPERMDKALAEHDRIVREAIATQHGYVFSTAGDSFGAAFATADQAVAAAEQAQRELKHAATDLRLQIRVALHTGEAAVRDGDYFGAEVNRCARIMAAAHGGQVVLSQATVDVLGPEREWTDLGEHRLKDLSRPERLYQLAGPGPDQRFPPLNTVEGPSTALPAPVTHFIGRELELIELNRLAEENRLVTLTGSGGAGKTRLALQFADDARFRFPDGLRWVELAAVSDREVLVDEVAQAFGVKAAADTPLVETLVASIGTRRAMLILDNCEQLVSAAAALINRILEGCQNVTVLATSRQLLGVNGEAVYRVPSMTIPEVGASADRAMTYDAITMFVDRARLTKPDFVIDDATVDDVVAICARLDGIPLALELAAARLRAMSTAQIAERLDQRFLSVAAGSNAGSRHHTLQHAIDWSFNLLSPAERRLFLTLGVFTGDFDLAAAESVGASSPLDGFSQDGAEIAETLFGLVDKSMIKLEHGRENRARYQLLESMRNYAVAALDAEGRLEVELGRHLEYYAGFCEGLRRMERSGDLATAIATLDENEDNIRAALRYGLHSEQHVEVARIIGALGYLWYAAGLYREGSEWCTELFQTKPDLPDELRAAALHSYGTLLGSWAQPDVGVEVLEHEVELRRGLNDPARLAAALNNLGNLLHDVGRFDDAQTTLREAIDQFRLAGESPTLALASLGAGYLHGGDLDQAAARYAEALEEAVVADNAYGMALATSYLGQCAALQGRLHEGRELLEEARTRFSNLMVTPGIANADFHLALIERAEAWQAPPESVDLRLGAAAERLLQSLSAAEAHWYLATQYWILQVVASIIPDADTAAVLLGVASAHYGRSAELQPAYVMADLERTVEMVGKRLPPSEAERCLAKGRRTPPHDAIALASAALQSLIGKVSPTSV